jgi:hypothetical protein
MTFSPSKIEYIVISSSTKPCKMFMQTASNGKIRVQCMNNNNQLDNEFSGDFNVICQNQALYFLENDTSRIEISFLVKECIATVTGRKRIVDENLWEAVFMGPVFEIKLRNIN